MPWTSPPTFASGYVVPASDLNLYLRDNPNYLLSGMVNARSTYVGGADYTTTSGTFAAVDTSNVKIAITPKSTRAEVCFIFFGGNVGASPSEFDIFSVTAAARLGDATHGMAQMGANRSAVVTLIGIATGLTPDAANTFQLYFRSPSGVTTTIAANGVPIHMWAREV